MNIIYILFNYIYLLNVFINVCFYSNCRPDNLLNYCGLRDIFLYL